MDTRHLLSALVLLGAMTFFSPAEATAVSFRVENAPAATLPEIAKTLEKRFETLKPGLFSSVSTEVHGGVIEVDFSGWTPTPKQLEYLTQTVGKLRFTFQGDAGPLITEEDIVDAVPGYNGDKPELHIKISDSAAARVLAATRDATGRIVAMEWDGTVIQRLRVSGPLPRAIALTASSSDEARLMSAVLRGGRLPERVELVATSPSGGR
jgi:hypothetical protein